MKEPNLNVVDRIREFPFSDRLTDELMARIERAVKDAAAKMTLVEFQYIHARIREKFEAVHGILPKDLELMLQGVGAFYNCLLLNENQYWELTSVGRAIIGAGLFYFLDPFDLIPDEVSEIGYLDDFFALKVCLDILSDEDREKIRQSEVPDEATS